MARPFDMIKEVNDLKETWKIAVRISDLWTVTNKARHEHYEMIFMDANGDKIHAVVPKDDMGAWRNKLIEKKTYVFENFVVHANDFQFKVCDHPYKMVFSDGTIFKDKDFPDISISPYQFKNFGDILSGNFRTDLLVDLIGLVHNKVFTQTNASPKKVVFNVKDQSGKLLNVTLWESTAMRFLNYFEHNTASGSVIIILTHAKLKQGQGNFPPSVSNSWFGSKLTINEDIEEIHSFRRSLPATEVTESSSQSLTQFTGSSQFSEQDRFVYKALIKSLHKINELKEETTCVTVATTGKFIVNKNGWSYEGCSGCTRSRKGKVVDGPWSCDCGKYNETTVPRYKLEIRVYDRKDSAKFVFWDSECAKYIGKTALELRNQMIEAGEDNPKSYPKALDDILARTLALRIKVQPSYNQSSVNKTWDDQGMIQTILDQIDPQEETSKQPKENSAPIEDVQFDTQSLSATAEHDPEMMSSITPAKRDSSDMLHEQKLSEEIASAQLSSTKITKITKIIKTE